MVAAGHRLLADDPLTAKSTGRYACAESRAVSA